MKILLVVAVMTVIFVAPAEVHGDESCCLNNFRFAGGCMVVARGQETCQDVISYLNNFNSVGKYYCDNTMVRGGWSLSDCGNPAQSQTKPYNSTRVCAAERHRPSRPSPNAR